MMDTEPLKIIKLNYRFNKDLTRTWPWKRPIRSDINWGIQIRIKFKEYMNCLISIESLKLKLNPQSSTHILLWNISKKRHGRVHREKAWTSTYTKQEHGQHHPHDNRGSSKSDDGVDLLRITRPRTVHNLRWTDEPDSAVFSNVCEAQGILLVASECPRSRGYWYPSFKDHSNQTPVAKRIIRALWLSKARN